MSQLLKQVHHNALAIFKIMTFKHIFVFSLVSTHLRTFVWAKDECYVEWIGGTLTPIDECSLLFNETLEVRLDKLVNNSDCLNENTRIGIAVNQETDNKWDSIQNLAQNKDFATFNSTKSLCHPLNVTVGMYFYNGGEWKSHKVTFELNPNNCLNKNLHDLLIREKIQTKCHNLTWATLPPEPTGKTNKVIEHGDTSEGESEWKLSMEAVNGSSGEIDASEWRVFQMQMYHSYP